MKNRITLLIAASAFAATIPVTAADFTIAPGTTVTVGGLFAVGLKDMEVTNTSRNLSPELRLDDDTSRVWIGGSTKVNDDLKLIYRVEARYQADVRPADPVANTGPFSSLPNTGSVNGWGDGASWVGFQGPWGRLTFGKDEIYYVDTIDLSYFGEPAPGEGYRAWDANGLGVFNILDQVGSNVGKTFSALLENPNYPGLPYYTLGIGRVQNLILYKSPDFEGFKFALGYTKNPGSGELDGTYAKATLTKNYESGGTTYAKLEYNTGGFTSSFSYLNEQVQGGQITYGAGPFNTVAYRVGAAYKFPMGFKVGVVYDNTEVDNGILGGTNQAKRGAIQVPVSYNWGKHAVYATYSKADDTSGLSNSGAHQVNLGYDYALTRAAFIGVYWTQLTNESAGEYQPFLTGTTYGGTAPIAGESWHTLAICMNWWF